MKTLILRQPNRFSLEDTASPPDPRAHEAQVRVRSIGICGTDIHSYRASYAFATYPRILGHELGVEIVKLGRPNPSLAEGDRCSVEPYLTCGTCRPCRKGMTNCCEALQCLGVHVDGGMRELINVPVDNLRVSRRTGLDQLALVEMLGVGKHAVDRAAMADGNLVAVVGLGPIGMSVAVFAQRSGARVVGIELDEHRATAARQLTGIEMLLRDPSVPLAEQWVASYERLPDVVIDASGNQGSMQSAFELPAHGGKLVFVGLIQGAIQFHVPSSHRREMTTLSSRNCVGRDFDEIIAQMDAGELNVAPWITHACSLTEFPGEFDRWLAPGANLVKGLVRIP